VTTHVSLIDHTQKHEPGSGVLSQIASALTRQVSHDFAPAWGLRAATVDVGGSGQPIHLFDNPDVAGALGYHDVDPHGAPYAHVFTDPSVEQGGSGWLSGPYSISSVISHELLEMLGDAQANRFAFDGRSRLWAQEACDAVEASSYLIAGVPVSNFVRPAWFAPGASSGFDHLGKLAKPFAMEKGGYSIVARMGTEGQVTAEMLDDGLPDWQYALKAPDQGASSRSFWRSVNLALLEPEEERPRRAPAKKAPAKKAAAKKKPAPRRVSGTAVLEQHPEKVPAGPPSAPPSPS
jgi:hypothetical protein